MNKFIVSGGPAMEYPQNVQHNHLNANAYSGYPQNNPDAHDHSGYPQYIPDAHYHSGYPQNNPDAHDHSGYPQNIPDAHYHSGYPQNIPDAHYHSGYPQYNPDAHDHSGYPQYIPDAHDHSGYPQYNPNASMQSGYGQHNWHAEPFTMPRAAASLPPYEQAVSGPGAHVPPPSVASFEHMAVADDRESESGSGGNDTAMKFSEKSIRHAFIKKVYAILMVQLIVTIGIICMFIYWERLKVWAWENPWLVYATIPATFVLLICLSCCSGIRRKAPCNFILLLLFTLLEGVLLGSVACYYAAESVMWAVGITAFISLGLTIFSVQTKIDFTMKSGVMFVFLMALLSFGLMCAILRNYWANIAYATLGALLFSVYLVIDTQLMLGGKHRYSVSPEEYVYAALNLYIDIVNIFLFILAIFQR